MDAGTWSLARRSAWAHRAGFAGTLVVLALAGTLLALAGVLAESGLRAGPGSGSGLLLALAGSYAGTLLAVVVLVVAATVGLALRGRRRELALLRTVGATRSQLRTQISAEVLLLTVVAAPLGGLLGLLLASRTTPLLRAAGLVGADASLSLGPLPVLGATVLLLPVAWLAAHLSVRETLRAAPGPAARSAAVEATGIGGVRRVAAVVTGVLGLVAAFSPLVVPGTVGSAAAATSAFLLVGAAALAGPALLGWAFARTAGGERLLGPAGRLAVANTRGFSQRLTMVVVPLALALTAGTAQTTVDRTVATAAEGQLRDALRGDLVVDAPAGLSASDVDAVGRLRGVAGTTSLASAPASVLTDEDLDGVVDSLAWEPTTVRSVDPATADGLLDPGVTAGTLADLSSADTVAVGRDAVFATGLELGGTVPLRWADGTTTRARVVAVFERGLGLGDYLVGPGTLDDHRQGRHADALVVGVDRGSVAEVRAAVAGLGLDAAGPAAYAERATTAGAADRRLSTVLLLTLLGFVLLAAANALVMVTARRRDELALYGRTGATRGQLTRMAALEAALTGGLGWLIGTLAVLPAVLGVSVGMLGPVPPPVDLAAYLALSAVVLVLPLVTVVPVAVRMTRRP